MNKTRRRLAWAGLTLLIGVTTLVYIRIALPLIPSYGKGGIGNAGNGSFVLTLNQKNSAICGNAEWHGLLRQNAETIKCGPDGALPFRLSMLLDGALLIHFKPDRIYILDLATFSGGYYLRGQDENSVAEKK